MPFSSGGLFATHWFMYLCMARETRENGIVQDAREGTSRFCGHSLVVLVFSALSVEGFINELAEMAGRDVDSSDEGRTSARPAEIQVLADSWSTTSAKPPVSGTRLVIILIPRKRLPRAPAVNHSRLAGVSANALVAWAKGRTEAKRAIQRH